jgi:hypothetical protein
MLSAETFARGIQLMNSVCTKQIETDDTMNVYFMSLSDLEDSIYLESIMLLIKTKENTFAPFSPAEIINKANELKNLKRKHIEIFDRLKLDAIKYGSSNKPKYKQEIEEALESIGGWGKFCNTEEDKLFYLERDFLKELNVKISENNKLLSKIEKKKLLK